MQEVTFYNIFGGSIRVLLELEKRLAFVYSGDSFDIYGNRRTGKWIKRLVRVHGKTAIIRYKNISFRREA